MNKHLSLERIVPDDIGMLDAFDQASLRLHIERYMFAIQHGKPGLVLDIACGSGYGADLIIKSGKFSGSRIIAADIDEETIAYAKKRYGNPAIHFVCRDAMSFSGAPEFDSIICLETVEHVKDPGLFVQGLYGLLKAGGVLIISAPVTPSTDGNPYHLSDFSPGSFKKLFLPFGLTLVNQFSQVQAFSLHTVFRSKNKRLEKRRHRIGRYYFLHPAVFFARIRSVFIDGFRNKYLTLVFHKS
jgi:SAM-dependent methyltransferase